MKSLEKVQKICKVLKILAKIVFVCSIVSASLFAVLTVVFAIIGKNLDVVDFFASIDLPYDYYSLLGLLICLVVESCFSIAMYSYVVKFYDLELSLGNPFDKPLIKEMRKLGILHIVFPLVSSLVCDIISAIFGAYSYGTSMWSGVTLGIVYLLLSCVIEYGSELKRK